VIQQGLSQRGFEPADQGLESVCLNEELIEIFVPFFYINEKNPHTN
jgi:hypothetical protein